jgi:methionyl-tRNA formyltransferase
MGTPEFAVPSLNALIEAGFQLSLVVSQPDRKKDRGQKIQFPPTKVVALEHKIEVFQPESIRTPEAIGKLAASAADFFVVIAYGKILPESVLNVPEKACINVHASLLPLWRGAAPIQFSLLHGDEHTGVCTMLMDKEMDTGDLLLSRETAIEPDENCGQLSERLAKLGAALLVDTINRFDQLTPVKQDHKKATYTRLLKKEDRVIHWGEDSRKVFCQFRAMTPLPGVVTEFRGKRLLIKSMRQKDDGRLFSSQKPGEIIAVNDTTIDVACRSGVISVLSCQPESKKEVSVQEFVNGYQVKPGEIIGVGA